MKTAITTIFSILMLVAVTLPVSAAEEDINPTTRSESEIAAQMSVIAAQLERIRDLMGASVAESTPVPGFVVTVDGSTVVNKETTGMTKASAAAQCDEVAYNTENMWKLVTCTFAGETIYSDVFIAG